MIPLGTVTKWGKIIAVGFVGERYYWTKQGNTLSMMPADVIEKEPKK